MISQFVKQAFPNTEHKKLGKQRQTYVLGIEPVSEAGASFPSSSECQLLQQEVKKLRDELCWYQQEVKNLQEELGECKRTVEALQQEVSELRTSSISPSLLQSQMQAALRPNNLVHSGPSSVERFKSFSIQNVIAELKRHTPDVYNLIAALGTTHTRPRDDQGTNVSDLRSLTSLCTLLKNRSMKVLGIQLLLTFMLIARATSKQVRKSYNYF